LKGELELKVKGYQAVTATILLLLLGVFCLKPPEMPEWDTQVNVPLYSRVVRLVDFLDSTKFRILPDSSIEFHCSFPIDTVSPEGVIDLVSVNESRRIGLADFTFTSMPAFDLRVGLEDVVGMPLPDSGLKVLLPGFETSLARPCSIPDLAYAEVVSGVLRAEVTNQTGVPLDSVGISVCGLSLRLAKLGPGGVKKTSLEFGGVCFEQGAAAEIVFGSAGSGKDTVLLTKADEVKVRLELDSLKVSAAKMKVPKASGKRRCQVTTQSSKPFRIDSLRLSSGVCRIVLENQFSIPVRARLDVPAFGRSYEQDLPGRGSTQVDVDLSGARVDNRSRTNCILDFLVNAEPVRCQEFVELGKSDGVSIGYATDELKPEMIAGEFLQPVYVGTRLETLPPFLPRDVNGVRLPKTEIMLDIDNAIGFPMDARLQLTAYREGAEGARLEQPLAIAPGAFSQPNAQEWALPIDELLNVGPDVIVLEQVVRMTGSGCYTRGSWLAGRASITTPMRMAFAADTVRIPGTAVRIAEEHRRRLAEHFAGAVATIDVANHFPMRLSGWLELSADSSASPVPGVLVDTVRLPFGVCQGRMDHGGNCVGDVDTSVVCELDTVQATLLRKSPLQAKVFLCLEPSDTLNFKGTDRLSLSARVALGVRMKPWW